MIQKNDIERASFLFPCFSELSKQDWELAKIANVRPASPHSLREGHELQHAMFILSGSVRIYKISNSGKEVTLYRVQSGECCVLMMASILGETEYEASVHVETETDVLLFPVDNFRKWMYMYKSIRQMIYRQFIVRWTDVANLLERIAFCSIHERISGFLIERQTTLGHSSNIIEITHEQLAIELGTSREVVSRALKEFSDRGAILLQRGKICIVDLKK